MAKVGRTLTDLAAEIMRQAEVRRDFLAPVSKLAVEVITTEGKPEPMLALTNGSTKLFPITPTAHQQVAEFVKIPMPYYRRMVDEDPGLLASNVNRWLRDQGNAKRLVRTLDDRARAFLSNGYRPLDNDRLAEAVLPVIQDRGLVFLSCEITESRLYIKAIDPRITRDVPTGRLLGDGSHVFFDTVSPGITISNSEIGAGTLRIETSIFTRACTNLCMMGTAMKKYHAGKRAELGEEILELLTDETKQATDKAIWLQARDMVAAAFDTAKFEAQAMKLGDAAKDRVPAEAAPEVVELAGRKWGLTEGERKGILGRFIEGADLTRYGLHAAITRHSADLESYDRATELERLGGEVIDLSPSQWREVLPREVRELEAA